LIYKCCFSKDFNDNIDITHIALIASFTNAERIPEKNATTFIKVDIYFYCRDFFNFLLFLDYFSRQLRMA